MTSRNQNDNRLRIAIQKKGRLNSDSVELLLKCGLKMSLSKNTLFCHVQNLPIDLLFVRDDDIPTLVMDKICDVGIVGENVLLEHKVFQNRNGNSEPYCVERKLGFGRCRLSIAIPADKNYSSNQDLNNKQIATSYPHLLEKYLNENNVNADILTLSGSVEIAPRLNMADAICDLVSTGRTLEENNLKEVAEILSSEAVLIKSSSELTGEKNKIYERLLRRIVGVQKAQESKYIMFHAPKDKLYEITKLLPGSETPTIVPLEENDDKMAVHIVSKEGIFWDKLEQLKEAGASSILVMPIEKMMS